MGKTLSECRENATRWCAKKKDSYVYCTIPFAVFKVPGSINTYDVSVPIEIKRSMSLELRMLLDGRDE
jgi:hypothetical protein